MIFAYFPDPGSILAIIPDPECPDVSGFREDFLDNSGNPKRFLAKSEIRTDGQTDRAPVHRTTGGSNKYISIYI